MVGKVRPRASNSDVIIVIERVLCCCSYIIWSLEVVKVDFLFEQYQKRFLKKNTQAGNQKI